jgi:hypothetical protein
MPKKTRLPSRSKLVLVRSSSSLSTCIQVATEFCDLHVKSGRIRALAVVKHKMTRDVVDAKIMAAIVAEDNAKPPEFVSALELPSSPVSTFSSTCGLALVELEAVDTYSKMLQKHG